MSNCLTPTPRVLIGKRDELLAYLQQHAPCHVTLTWLNQATWKSTTLFLYDPVTGTPTSVPCPALAQQYSGEALQIGILTEAGFLRGAQACSRCVHQLACAVDGQTRTFRACADEKIAKSDKVSCDV